MSNLFPGSICEISKAYDHETGARTMVDEYAHCECEVLELRANGEALVWVKGRNEEVFVNQGRLKRIR